MNPLLYKYPLDLSGVARDNRIIGEIHSFDKQAMLPYRCFCLDAGYFYTEDLVIRDATGVVLTKADYQCTSISQEATRLSGREVCGVIVITNPRIKNTVYVDAQMVGGEFCDVSPSIANMAASLLNGTRKAHWKNIVGKPDKFKVNGHLHALWDIYGFDGWVIQLKRLLDAKLKSSANRYGAIREQYDARLAEGNSDLDALYAELQRHIDDKDNPHKLTAKDLGVEKVQNFPVSSESEAKQLGNGVTQRYTTPLRTAQHIQANFGNALNAHINNVSNPHQVTAIQLGAMDIPKVVAEMRLYLGIRDTARSTAKFAGKTYAQFYSELRSNLSANQINSGRLALQQLGVGSPKATSLLMGSGWNEITSFFSSNAPKRPSIQYLTTVFANADAALNNVKATFADINAYPVGTMVVVKYKNSWSAGTGNGSYTATLNSFIVITRYSGGWSY